jgi:hypothetical protein
MVSKNCLRRTQNRGAGGVNEEKEFCMRLVNVIALVLLLPTIALADEWSHTTTFESANTASIRVVEPEGYQITINGHTDNAPAVFRVANADNYLAMTVVAPSGEQYERKVEVKAYRQTVIRIRHVASAAPKKDEKPAKRASFIGVVANTTHLCKAADRRDIKVEFILDADSIKTVEVAARARVDAELPGGEYRIRRFHRTSNGWEFAGTETLSISKDSWVYHWGCAK